MAWRACWGERRCFPQTLEPFPERSEGYFFFKEEVK